MSKDISIHLPNNVYITKVSVKAVVFNERMCAEQTIPTTSELHTKKARGGYKINITYNNATKTPGVNREGADTQKELLHAKKCPIIKFIADGYTQSSIHCKLQDRRNYNCLVHSLYLGHWPQVEWMRKRVKKKKRE